MVKVTMMIVAAVMRVESCATGEEGEMEKGVTMIVAMVVFGITVRKLNLSLQTKFLIFVLSMNLSICIISIRYISIIMPSN